MNEGRGMPLSAISLVALCGVLLSLMVGCFGGAVAGYLTGRWQTRATAKEIAEALEEMAQEQEEPYLHLPPRRIPIPEILPEEMPGWEIPFDLMEKGLSGALIEWVEPDSPADEDGAYLGIRFTPLYMWRFERPIK